MDDAEIKESELDKEGFDAEKYVADVLAREGLEGVLRVEAGLISGEWFCGGGPNGKGRCWGKG